MSEVFLRAAEIKSNPHWYTGCCSCISDAAGADAEMHMRADKYFAALFRPACNPYWWWADDEQEPRILALLFAAQIAKSEGL